MPIVFWKTITIVKWHVSHKVAGRVTGRVQGRVTFVPEMLKFEKHAFQHIKWKSNITSIIYTRF